MICTRSPTSALSLAIIVEHARRVAVRAVHDEDVDAGVGQRHGTRPRVVTDTDRRADQQTAVAVLGGVGMLFGLDEVLDGDQAGELALTVDDRQLLDLVTAQQPECGLGGDAFLRGDRAATWSSPRTTGRF